MGLLVHRILPIAVCLSNAACVPFPHSATLSPDIRGSLVIQGRAAVDTKVFLASGPTDDPCRVEFYVTFTDKDGRFHVPRRSAMRFFYAPLVAPVSFSEYTLCATLSGRTLAIEKGAVQQQQSPKIYLDCTFSAYIEPDRSFEAITQKPPKQPCQQTSSPKQ